MKRKRIVVLGYMGACPLAGVVWQHIHYIVGLERLGHEVYYVEDTARYPYNPAKRTVEDDYSHAAATLASLAQRFGFRDRWAFRARYLDGQPTAGLSSARLRELYREADAILNVCGSHELNEDLLESRRLILVESDPGFQQIRVDNGDAAALAELKRYQRLFTFGESIGTERFPVPLHGLEWLPTRQPVVTSLWEPRSAPEAGAPYSTVTNWSASQSMSWRGKPYHWSKSAEFMKFVDAPVLTKQAFELASDIPDGNTRALFERHGWRLVHPDSFNYDLDAYRSYIQAAKGEFTATKEIVVVLDTAWFSDRSVCYLAAGRPVITEETGFTRLYGGERGLFGFRNMDDIVEAAKRIAADYPLHSRAARDIARETFEAGKVLASLLERAGV
jgi:hypothetical protein